MSYQRRRSRKSADEARYRSKVYGEKKISRLLCGCKVERDEVC